MTGAVLPTEALTTWCRSALGSGIAETLFEQSHLSRVRGVVLQDGREAVIKMRLWQSRLPGCVAVQRHLSLSGYPCPAALTDVARIGEWAIHAEALVLGGEQ